MSDVQPYNDLIDDEPTEPTQDGQKKNGLREFAEKQAEENKRLKKELEDLRTESRKSAIEKAVEAAGFPPAAVELAAIQVQDPAEIETWLESKRKGFGVPDRVESAAPSGTPSVDASLAQNIQRMQEVQPGQFNPTGHEAVSASLDAATSKDDFYARLRANNMLNG